MIQWTDFIFELRKFGLKVLIVLLISPLFASSLLYIIEKIRVAWKEENKKKKFWALTMLMVLLCIFFGWLQ